MTVRIRDGMQCIPEAALRFPQGATGSARVRVLPKEHRCRAVTGGQRPVRPVPAIRISSGDEIDPVVDDLDGRR